jgi:mRNA interferase RelE/StbE
VGAAVVNAFTRLQADPWTVGKRLRGDFAGLWSMRVGSYRILYTIEGPESRATVVVRAVDHRRAVYRRKRS